MLRATQIGLHLADLEALNFGDVLDIMTERGNDDVKYKERATQSDFDRF